MPARELRAGPNHLAGSVRSARDEVGRRCAAGRAEACPAAAVPRRPVPDATEVPPVVVIGEKDRHVVVDEDFDARAHFDEIGGAIGRLDRISTFIFEVTTDHRYRAGDQQDSSNVPHADRLSIRHAITAVSQLCAFAQTAREIVRRPQSMQDFSARGAHRRGTLSALSAGMDPCNCDRMRWLIEQRHSSRMPFDPNLPVKELELAHIIDAARWAPTAHNMQNFRLVVVDDRYVLDQLGRIRAPVSPAFVIENYRQLSWSPEELAERKVGILGNAFPPAWRTDDPEHVPTDLSRLLGETIAGAPMVIVAIFDPTKRAPASEGDVLGMISLGCVLENMWLAAHASHLDVQVVSAFSSDGAESAVKRVLQIPAPWRIAYAIRVGHAVSRSTSPRVRRDATAFTSRNRFG